MMTIKKKKELEKRRNKGCQPVWKIYNEKYYIYENKKITIFFQFF